MFSLPGPQFLVLFAGLSCAVWVIVHLMIEVREARLSSDPRIRDPYAIAYLRGDTRELIRVVALSLYMRGLLQIRNTTFVTANPEEIERAHVPIEKQFLQICRTPCQPSTLPQAPQFKAAVDLYHHDLVARGLLADEAVKRQRGVWVLLGSAFLVAVALFKIKVALATGHHNIAFLIILTLLALFILAKRAAARRTSAGSAALQKLKTLFASLRKRRRPSSTDAVSEAALLAAVFGVYEVSGLGKLAWARMFPNSNSSDSSTGSSSCGSSGCGGGGGGGGGCGGCGS